MNTDTVNPYIGPRTFLKEEGHLFFGREREARDLAALVSTQRLVLFYAQSGAGKSSLINTRLIPELEQELYEVLPVSRVSGDAPEGIEVANIYSYNLMRSLMRREVDPRSLSHLTLSRFLGRLNEDENGYYYDDSLDAPLRGNSEVGIWRRALIIDQFEELFTTHQEAWEQRDDFFKQLAQAMQDDPQLWVVLVMREDYIAMVDPYAHILPGGLLTRYYMQRLEKTQAIQAVQGPAKRFNRTYATGAAKTLVDALSRVNVRGQDNQWESRPGQYVEPVQLQVVCSSLWRKLADDEFEISNDRVAKHVEDINEALGNFYEERVQAVANGKLAQERGVSERDIRIWFEEALIIDGKRRNLVARQLGGKSGGLDDRVVQEFLGSLVREEVRSGGSFYELTHDRMVEPIVQNNQRWELENNSPFNRQAEAWKESGGNEVHLLSDAALLEAENWAEQNPAKLTKTDLEFLAAGKKRQKEQEAAREAEIRRAREEQEKLAQQQKLEAAQRLADEQARSARRARIFSIVAILLTIFAVFGAISAVQARAAAEASAAIAIEKSNIAATAQAQAESEKVLADQARAEAVANAKEAQKQEQRAKEEADKALAGNLAAQADSLKNTNYPVALLLGMEAYQRDKTFLTRTTLFNLLQFTPYERQFNFAAAISSVAVSPDGSTVAVASCKNINKEGQCTLGGVNLYNSVLSEDKSVEIPGKLGLVYDLAFYQYPDQMVLAVAGCVPTGSGCLSNRGQISLWTIPAGPGQPTKLYDSQDSPNAMKHTGLVKTIVFSPDGKSLASGSNDTTILLWDVSDPGTPKLKSDPIEGHSSFVNGLAFSPDNKTLVSASDDRTIRLWDISNPEQIVLLKSLTKHSAPVNSVAFSPDGTTFASASNDNQVILWKWASDPASLTAEKVLKGHTGYVKSIAFSQDGKLLASAGFDNSIILWNVERGDNFGEQAGPPLNVHTGTVNSVAFGSDKENSDGLYLISGSDDRTLIKWDLSARQPISRSLEIAPPSTQPALSASNAEYEVQANGQQVDVKILDATDTSIQSFILTGFTKPISNVTLSADDLLTQDQNQSINWSTLWMINPENWVENACLALANRVTTADWELFLQSLPAGDEPRQTCVVEP